MGEAIDIRHSLHFLEPPSNRVVRLLGVDIGNVLALLLGLGSGGSTRARFQLVALANILWRGRSTSEIVWVLVSLQFWKHLCVHVTRVSTLYLTLLAHRTVPMLLRANTLFQLVKAIKLLFRGP